MERNDYPEPVEFSRATANPAEGDSITPVLPFPGQLSADLPGSGQRASGSQDESNPHQRLARLQSITSTLQSSSASRNASLAASLSTRPTTVSEWHESPFSELRLIGTPEVFRISLPWEASCVGLSSDCTAATFFRDRSLFIVSLASVQTKGHQSSIGHTFKGIGRIRQVSASQHYVAVLADEWLALLKYDVSTSTGAQTLDVLSWVPIEWDPRGLALHESRDEVLIIAGERRQGLEGRIRLYHCPLHSNRGTRLYGIKVFKTTVGGPRGSNDLPSTLAFHPNGRSFVCATAGVAYNRGLDRRRSSILVWPVELDSSTASKPYEILYHYTAETDAGGITSARLFDSPSGKSYVVVTSSPSSERSRNEGEYSFISPVDCTAQHPVDLSPLLHPLEKLAKHPAIRDGAVPRRGNLVALLEKSGGIVLLPLIADDGAGLITPSIAGHQPPRLSSSLCQQRRSNMGSLRFDPPGTLLYAADTKGKLIRACFTQDEPGAGIHNTVSSDIPELFSKEIFQIGQGVDTQEPLKPDLDHRPTREVDQPAQGTIGKLSILDKLMLRKHRRSR
ncbi:MAG: hypothetical protein Q9227_001992 [Pyrenula ochraceoflavens]